MPIWGTGPRRPDGRTNNLINATPTFLLPTQVSSLRVWLDSADISTFVISSVSTVITWRDKSQFGSHFSTNSGAPQLNLNAGVLFSNTRSDLMISLSSIQIFNGNTTLFAVGGFPAGVTQSGYIISLAGGGQDLSIRFNNGSVNQNDIFWQSPNYLNGSVVPWYRAQTTSFIVDGITSNNNFLTSPQYNTSTIALSSRFANRFYNGYISEVLIYNYALADFERRGIEAYLARKWGVQNSLPFQHPGRPSRALAGYRLLNISTILPASNPYIWFDAMNTGTLTDVFGNTPARNQTAIARWLDRSVNRFNLSNSGNITTSPFFNLMGCNVYPEVNSAFPNFNGFKSIVTAGQTVLNANAYKGSSISLFYVLTVRSGTGTPLFAFSSSFNQQTVISVSTTTDIILSHDGTNIQLSRIGSGQTSNNVINAPLPINTRALVSIYVNGDNSTIGGILPSTNTININSAFVSSSTRFAGNPFNLQYLSLFTGWNFGGTPDVNFSELIQYNRVLGTQERTALESQLIRKWQLPTNQPVTFININPVTSGLYFDIDAYDPNFVSTSVTNDGLTRVDTVFDRSGNNRNFKFATNFSNIFYNRVSTMNQFNSLYFSTGATTAGVLSNINPINSFSTNSYSFFIVYNQLSSVTIARLLAGNNQTGSDTTVGGFSYQVLGQTTFFVPRDYQFAGSNIINGRNYLYSLINNGGPTYDIFQTSTFYSYHNTGTGPTLLSNINSASTNLLNISQFNIGGRNTTTNLCFNGLISQVLLYNRGLSNSERLQVENYLINKWGISTLVSNVPVTRGLNLWLDCYDSATVLFSTNTNLVTQWRDKSLCNLHMSNPGTIAASRMPTYTTASPSGLPSLLFSNSAPAATFYTNLWNNNFTYPITRETTLFVTYSSTSNAGFYGPLFTMLSNNELYYNFANGFGLNVNNGDASIGLVRSTIRIYTSGVANSHNITTLASVVFNSSFSTTLIADIPQNNFGVGRNGMIGLRELSSFISSVGLTSTQNFLVNQASIGTRGTGTIGDPQWYYSGFIHEVLLYNRTLSFDERQQVETYLMSKWNI